MTPPLSHVVRSATLVAGLLIAGVAGAQNAAIVNGTAIPSARVNEFVSAMTQQGRPDTPELRNAIREELIARELFTQEAVKRGLTRNPEIAAALANARQDILIRAMIRDHLRTRPVTDDEIKAEYDKLAKSGGGGQEYRARHILVESEAEAKGIVEQLGKGAKFEDLAKKSKDPGSAQRGGDLDWANADNYVPPFAEALKKLAKGQLTEAPVKTDFGWHVIRLDDVRDVQPPPLEQVKPQVQQELERRRIQDLQKDLRAKAKVQ